jgi:hypothetical protein
MRTERTLDERKYREKVKRITKIRKNNMKKCKR